MLLPAMWQSCNDDDFRLENSYSEFQGIGVNIPYVPENAELSRSTRSELSKAGQPQDFVGEEAKINSLYIFAFANGKTGVSDVVKLDASEIENLQASADHPGFKCYPFELEVGEYHVYLVANVDLGASYKSMTEDDVKNYQFAAVSGDLSAFPNGLPMSCGASQVVSDSKKVDNYIPVKTKESTHISASLKFAVSKVRISVINDITSNYAVTAADVKKIADNLNLFADSNLADPTVNGQEKSMLSYGTYYDLPEMSNGKYPVDDLTGGVTASPSGTWVWQTTFYVPERTTDNTTEMNLAFTGGATKNFFLGEQAAGKTTLKRSKYYRYSLTPASGSIKLEVIDWNPEYILAILGGPVTLEVDKTNVGKVSGEEPQYVLYSSNVSVKWESPKHTVVKDGVEKEVDVFILTNDQKDGKTAYKVEVNPELGIIDDDSLSEKGYFYLIAGPLRKKILAEPDLSPYLIVTPENYTVVMKEISNEVEYSVEYTYSTNLSDLKYKFGDGSNDNTGTDLEYYIGGNQTEQVRPGSATNLGQNGRIVVKFREPYNPEKFQKESNIIYDYTATGYGYTKEATVTLNIIPNLNGYRLWFRDVNDWWDDDNKIVHVYVYQPLDYLDGKTVIPAKTWNDKQKEDALQYSFTGKHFFKGWSNVGTGYGFAEDRSELHWGDLNIENNKDNTSKYYQIDFLEDFRKDVDCDACKGSGYFRKWPGIAMKQVKDENSPQYLWWYIDLPAICEPGKALIMFTRGHDDNVGQQDRNWRYPLHMVPGIPLYDYPDHEGWLKYDPNDPNPQFVDDQPMDMTPAPTPTFYTINWPKTQFDGKDCWKIKMINAADDSEITNGFVQYSKVDDSKFFYQFTPSSDNLTFKLEFINDNGTVTYPESTPGKIYKLSDFDSSKSLSIPSIGTSDSTPVTEYDYYIKGSFTSSNWTEYKLVDGKVTITSTQSASFGIMLTEPGETEQKKWYASSGGSSITLDSPMGVSESSTNWDGLAAGTWTFTFDKVNMTLTISGTENGGGGNQDNDEMVTIYLLKCNDHSYWGVPYAYCYIDDDNKNANWPGQPMEQVAGQDGWYKLSVNKKLTNVIFSNNGANQLETVAIRPNGKYYSDNITYGEHTWE